MQTLQRLLLREWSEHTKLYPDIPNVSSSVEMLDLRYVSERPIMSNLWNVRYGLKRNNLT